MTDVKIRRGMIASPAVLALTVLALAQGARAAHNSRQAAGERIARAYCSPCHAIGRSGASPLADAPPFRGLYRRYPVGGGLNDLLAKGMVASVSPEEEGGTRTHPRMPQARLDEAQIGDLTAYLHWVQDIGSR